MAEYLRKRGLYPQSADDPGYHQTSEGQGLRPSQRKHSIQSTKCTSGKRDYHGMAKSWAWCVLFAHTPSGLLLDKFIMDSMLDTHVSHICHWPPCLTLANLELVLPYMNRDRTICKNNDRKYSGKCNAESSHHSHRPCFGRERVVGPYFQGQPEGKITSLVS